MQRNCILRADRYSWSPLWFVGTIIWPENKYILSIIYIVKSRQTISSDSDSYRCLLTHRHVGSRTSALLFLYEYLYLILSCFCVSDVSSGLMMRKMKDFTLTNTSLAKSIDRGHVKSTSSISKDRRRNVSENPRWLWVQPLVQFIFSEVILWKLVDWKLMLAL